MKLNKIFLFSIICISLTYGQFTEVLVNLEYSNVNVNELFVLENFEQEIQSYFMNNYFFDDPDELELILDINIIIENINSRGGEKIITAQMIFSNQKDSHLFSKSFDFVYQKNEALYKSEIFHPLTSLLNYYAYKTPLDPPINPIKTPPRPPHKPLQTSPNDPPNIPR